MLPKHSWALLAFCSALTMAGCTDAERSPDSVIETPLVEVEATSDCPAYKIFFDIGGQTFVTCFDDKAVYSQHTVLPLRDSLVAPLNGWFLVFTDSDVALYDPRQQQTYSLDFLEHVQNIDWATLSPDGEYIAYSLVSIEDSRISRSIVFAHLPTRVVSESPISSDTPGLQELKESPSPSWYPTWSSVGSQLAISDYGAVYLTDIICELDTHQCHPEGAARRVTPSDVSVEGPVSWSPDGTHFAAVCITTEKAILRICTFDMNGNVVRQSDAATQNLEALEFVDWSPDGMFIAFHAKKGAVMPYEVYVLRAIDLSIYAVLSSETEDYQYPMWVP